jgi:hypothetical protein
LNKEEIKNDINNIIEKELQKVIKKFNSSHEGYAVLLEELDKFIIEWNGISHFREHLWKMTMQNNKKEQLSAVEGMLYHTKKVIYEAIQIATVCKRYIKDIKL